MDAIYYEDSENFVGERNRVVPQAHSLANAKFFGGHDDIRQRLVDDFERPRLENIRRLKGEYAALVEPQTALTYLFERDGRCTKINYSRNEGWAKTRDEYCNGEEFARFRDGLLQNWDSMQLIPSMPLLSCQMHHNLFHFMFDLLGKLANYPEEETQDYAISLGMIQFLFQRTMTIRMAGSRRLYPLRNSVRVIDPMVTSNAFHDRGFEWLRNAAKFPQVASTRKIYIRRTKSTWGRTGCIVEDEAFLRFLRDHNFDIIDLGLGELTFDQQIGMLSGARVILTPHSSSLANFIYLTNPVSIVEILGTRWAWPPTLELSMALGFKWYGIFEDRYDERGDIHVDVDRLHEIMKMVAAE